MKFIHSLWSGIDEHINKNFIYYLFSALLVKKHGHTIELFCSENVKEKYSLIPYDKIHIVDFDNDNIDPKYWIYAKIKTYSLISEPFIHIDGDVFLFNDMIGKNFTNKFDLIVQSVEDENILIFDDYNSFYKSYHEPLESTPISTIIESNIDWYKYNLNAFNCGVVGFNNMKFKDFYVKEITTLLRNISKLDLNFSDEKYMSIMLILEQALLYYFTKENNIKYYDIISFNEIKKRLNNWFAIAEEIGYCHMWGQSKYKPKVITAIKNNINNNFPKYKNIINNFENKFL